MIQRDRELPLVGGFLRKIGIPLPPVSEEALNPPQPVGSQETAAPPSMEDVSRELDLIKLGLPKPPDDPETGFSYFGLSVSVKKLNGISAETRSALGINGGGGEVRITYAFDNMGIARKIHLRKGSRRASFIIDNGLSRSSSPLKIRGREEAEMSVADALLVAKIGSRRARV